MERKCGCVLKNRTQSVVKGCAKHRKKKAWAIREWVRRENYRKICFCFKPCITKTLLYKAPAVRLVKIGWITGMNFSKQYVPK